MNTLQQYLDLLPSANAGQPNFAASIGAALQDIIDDGNLAVGMPALFDLDSAVGQQLDVIGVWIGLSRNIPTPITGVYFSLDTVGLGLDEGYLRGPFDPVTGLTQLDDTTYRTMLRIKIASNHWDGSLAQAQQIIRSVFAGSPGTLLMMQDNFDMTITIGLAGIFPGALYLSLLKNYFEVIPAAVGLKELVVTSVSGAPIFGLDIESPYVSGLDVGALGIKY